MGTTFIGKEFINQVLANKPVTGKHQLEPLKSLALENKLPFCILEDSELLENEAEVHKQMGDLWYCLEGEVEFICGGELVNARIRENTESKEIAGDGIRGGVARVLKAGDWLWIPAGEAHTHTAAGTARLMIIKVPQI
ncbi:MAG: hypothetical protein UX10_C0006G0009 [Candidatus Magasanikbacteria bacterium GW2011_GWA2_45_39]|uniref:Cupin 2 conserved barrel domain-containing protein n=1 Tax=Candidatus Magasanikbacteria bacterium GW2011_GWA2_45_39 TaxID=1619041 RepID=A0A0G1PQM4_9BACT|nr:MAG: hypothetical protein UX10_C0006G0009 [Candidatus Magasanikbacteria bacterium GW2011_GWA2_45_39]